MTQASKQISSSNRRSARGWVIWGCVAGIGLAALLASAASPLLQWRDPIYILAGFAGVVAMAMLPLQPLAASRLLPGLSQAGTRRLHRWVGATVLMAVIAHVAGLWITSPPDVVDALTFTSPTPFSVWGVLAMWAVFVSAGLAVLRARRKLRWRTWQRIHVPLALVIVCGTVVHALLIDGTMEQVTKIALSVLLAGATASMLWALASGRRM